MPTRAWVRVVAGATLLDLAVSPLFAWSVFADDLAGRLHVAETALASVFSIGLGSFAAGVLLAGPIADRVAPRWLALVTAALAGAGLLGSGLAPSVAALVAAFGLGLGASTGLGYATAVRAAGTVDRRRGLALAIAVSAYAGGTIAVAPAAAALLGAIGPSATLAVLAAATAAVLLAAAALLPGRLQHRRPTHSDERLHLGRAELGLGAAFALGSAPGLAAFAHAGDVLGRPGGAAVAVLLLSVGNFAGRLIAGPASDRVGRPVALHTNAALLVGTSAALLLPAPDGVRLVLLLVLGLQYGALSVLVPAALGDSVPAARFGASYGVVFSGWGIAGLAAPVAAAALSVSAGWRATFLAFGAAGVAAWVAIGRLPGGSSARKPTR
ncbi:MAG TPA: MFS transporter [Candidatus Binatia bacterium]|nr:MFS transporter [Candidatus Binatia bacterium]